jgi:hypothetical protein
MTNEIFYEDDKYKIQGWYSTGSYFEVVDKLTETVVHTGFLNHRFDKSMDDCYYRLIEETKTK